MIRFSHSANSWQVAACNHGWISISAQAARELFDQDIPMWYDKQLILICNYYL